MTCAHLHLTEYRTTTAILAVMATATNRAITRNTTVEPIPVSLGGHVKCLPDRRATDVTNMIFIGNRVHDRLCSSVVAPNTVLPLNAERGSLVFRSKVSMNQGSFDISTASPLLLCLLCSVGREFISDCVFHILYACGPVFFFRLKLSRPTDEPDGLHCTTDSCVSVNLFLFFFVVKNPCLVTTRARGGSL